MEIEISEKKGFLNIFVTDAWETSPLMKRFQD